MGVGVPPIKRDKSGTWYKIQWTMCGTWVEHEWNMCGTRQRTHVSHCGRALPPRQRGCVCPTRPADPSAEFPDGENVALRPRAGFSISGRRTAIPIAPHMQVNQGQSTPKLTTYVCGDHHMTILPLFPPCINVEEIVFLVWFPHRLFDG